MTIDKTLKDLGFAITGINEIPGRKPEKADISYGDLTNEQKTLLENYNNAEDDATKAKTLNQLRQSVGHYFENSYGKIIIKSPDKINLEWIRVGPPKNQSLEGNTQNL